MIGINRFCGTGNLTKDPELKFLTSGDAVCTLRIAITRPYKNKGTGNYEADFFNVILWRKSAEYAANTFVKGDPIGVDGRLQSRQYEDKEGKKSYAVEIVADLIVDLRDRKKGEHGGSAPAGNNGGGSSGHEAFQDNAPIDDGDLPF